MAVGPSLKGSFAIRPYEDLAGMKLLLFWSGETFADEGEVALADGLE